MTGSTEKGLTQLHKLREIHNDYVFSRMQKASHSILFVFCLGIGTLFGQPVYSIKQGDPNGIGKWYMGRQIAQVMSHYGISWLERPEREMEENTSLLLRNLNLREGMSVADIGAGSGYHVSLMSPMVGKGKVYAVDIEPEMIRFLNNRIKQEKLNNVITVLGNEKSVQLPSASIDLMILVDVYHECAYPYELAKSMLDALKPSGRLVLVEFRTEDPEVPIKAIHKMSEKQAIREMEAAGLSFIKNITNLPLSLIHI